jgi:hypothetical protein
MPTLSRRTDANRRVQWSLFDAFLELYPERFTPSLVTLERDHSGAALTLAYSMRGHIENTDDGRHLDQAVRAWLSQFQLEREPWAVVLVCDILISLPKFDHVEPLEAVREIISYRTGARLSELTASPDVPRYNPALETWTQYLKRVKADLEEHYKPRVEGEYAARGYEQNVEAREQARNLRWTARHLTERISLMQLAELENVESKTLESGVRNLLNQLGMHRSRGRPRKGNPDGEIEQTR